MPGTLEERCGNEGRPLRMGRHGDAGPIIGAPSTRVVFCVQRKAFHHRPNIPVAARTCITCEQPFIIDLRRRYRGVVFARAPESSPHRDRGTLGGCSRTWHRALSAFPSAYEKLRPARAAGARRGLRSTAPSRSSRYCPFVRAAGLTGGARSDGSTHEGGTSDNYAAGNSAAGQRSIAHISAGRGDSRRTDP